MEAPGAEERVGGAELIAGIGAKGKVSCAREGSQRNKQCEKDAGRARPRIPRSFDHSAYDSANRVELLAR
jgi:hypothetical protein